MIKKIAYFIFIILPFLLSPNISIAEELNIGTQAPFFKVKSGNNKELSLDMLKGKTVVVFYETKDVVEKNRKLKDELNKLYEEQSDTTKELIARVPIITRSAPISISSTAA